MHLQEPVDVPHAKAGKLFQGSLALRSVYQLLLRMESHPRIVCVCVWRGGGVRGRPAGRGQNNNEKTADASEAITLQIFLSPA